MAWFAPRTGVPCLVRQCDQGGGAGEPGIVRLMPKAPFRGEVNWNVNKRISQKSLAR